MTVRRRHPIRTAVVFTLAAALSVTIGPAATAAGGPDRFPTLIPLPDGFAPEGIAMGGPPYAYLGSLVDGSIYRVDLRTGAGQVISPGPGTPSVGLDLDARGRLFVSGGPAGVARVVDVSTGEIVAGYQLATGASFINDVTVTRRAAWFTDSLNAVLYRVPLGPGGSLPPAGAVEAVPLTGDFQLLPGFNLNGITATPDGSGVLVVQSNTGTLFKVDPTGVTTAVDLGGEMLAAADGMLLRGTTLYVVQNRLNQVAVVRLDPAGATGTVVTRVGDPDFDVPTTVAIFGNRLYLPNARFGTPPTPDTPYDAVGIPIP